MPPPPRFAYPFAASPDVIRAHQKDAYFSGVLVDQLATLLRKLRGARVAHTHSAETHVAGELLYLALTTLLGNRTLGEEYCDVVQVEGEGAGAGARLPALGRRAGYLASCVLAPYLLSRALPVLRRRVRAKLEASLRRLARAHAQQASRLLSPPPPPPLQARVLSYLLQHLDALTSPSPVYAVSLAAFYFSGSYYHLSKRLWGLRYIFTRRVPASDQRQGYEVLGVLLALQMAVQAYLHLQSVAAPPAHSANNALLPAALSLDPHAYSANNALLPAAPAPPSAPSRLQQWTHTPQADTPRYGLADAGTMAWIAPANRKCTLCLDEMRDPSVTTCGHIFCWVCISDWAREKPECPLCRQACLAQHVLPLRG